MSIQDDIKEMVSLMRKEGYTGYSGPYRIWYKGGYYIDSDSDNDSGSDDRSQFPGDLITDFERDLVINYPGVNYKIKVNI